MLSQMDSHTILEEDLQHVQVDFHLGDCFVIPPGMYYEISPTLNVILAACDFYHRCNLQQTYGLGRLTLGLPGHRYTLKKFWVKVHHDFMAGTPPSLTKLRAIMANPHVADQGELFAGQGWLDPCL